jgi:hypothetical protein
MEFAQWFAKACYALLGAARAVQYCCYLYIMYEYWYFCVVVRGGNVDLALPACWLRYEYLHTVP